MILVVSTQLHQTSAQFPSSVPRDGEQKKIYPLFFAFFYLILSMHEAGIVPPPIRIQQNRCHLPPSRHNQTELVDVIIIYGII